MQVSDSMVPTARDTRNWMAWLKKALFLEGMTSTPAKLVREMAVTPRTAAIHAEIKLRNVNLFAKSKTLKRAIWAFQRG